MISPFTTAGLLTAIGGYNPPVQKDSRLGTVDAGYNGIGNPRVMFDGELTLSQKMYQFIGAPPGAGNRVVLTPLNGEYVITGVLGGNTGLSKDVRVYTTPILNDHDETDPHITTTPYVAASLTIPDPGWSYYICAGATIYYGVAAVTDGVATQWDAVCVLDNAETGPAVSRQGMGRATSSNTSGIGVHAPCGFQMGNTVYTGSHIVHLILARVAGDGSIWTIENEAYSGITVFQVPA
jgi:hypothetical protein